MPPIDPPPMPETDQIAPSNPEPVETLLSTKLFTPSIRPDHLSRPRLIAHIHAGIDKTLILISAPAGYGKTTLVCSFLHETSIPSAWISLDEGDNDIIRFLQVFLAALQKVVPTIQPEMLSALRSPASFPAFLSTIINEIGRFPDPFVLVLDDFHVAAGAAGFGFPWGAHRSCPSQHPPHPDLTDGSAAAAFSPAGPQSDRGDQG